jgi:hypothetical protein
MNDERVKGQRVGGFLNSIGLTLDCVLLWTPMITVVVPTTESP